MPTVLDRLNFSLHQAMQTDENVFVIGEDLLDPYGGAFKITRGLSTKFPDRIFTTPISEAAIVGVAGGMALRGLRPVAEIMFGDFITLAADQIVNHVAKFRWMYNNQVSVPLVIRTPMGGRRGYGPTHSQSLEKMFMGVPGLKVVAPNTLYDPAALLETAIFDDDPVLFIEHKLLYTRPLLESGKGDLRDLHFESFDGQYPAQLVKIPFSRKPHLTIACYGYNFELARYTALELLYGYEFFVEIILFSQLSPFAVDPLLESLKRSQKLLVIEEGSLSLGWGAELVARVAESGQNLQAVHRSAALDFPIPNSRQLEDAILPTQEAITRKALSLCDNSF